MSKHTRPPRLSRFDTLVSNEWITKQQTSSWTKAGPFIIPAVPTRKQHNGKCHVDDEKWRCNQANGPRGEQEDQNSVQQELCLFVWLWRTILNGAASFSQRLHLSCWDKIELTKPSIQTPGWIRTTGLKEQTYNHVGKAQKGVLSFQLWLFVTLHLLRDQEKVR